METYTDMKKLTIDELMAGYDRIAQNTVPGLAFYREELARRESNKLNGDMLAMTKQMRNMTIAIVVMTLVNVAVVIMQMFPNRP